MFSVSHCIRNGIRANIPQRTEGQRIGDQINAAMITTRADFVKVDHFRVNDGPLLCGLHSTDVGLVRWRWFLRPRRCVSANSERINVGIARARNQRHHHYRDGKAAPECKTDHFFDRFIHITFTLVVRMQFIAKLSAFPVCR